MKQEYIVFGSPDYGEDEINEVIDTLRSGWIGTGPKTQKFEKMFKTYKQSKYSVALNSCTAALHLSIKSIGLNPGDEVIIPTMTFAATANSIIHAGGIPIFADSEKETENIDIDSIREKITSHTKAIIPVHFAGRPCDIKGIMQIAKEYKLKVIEDCAHSIESEYNGKHVGTYGDLGCFSFYVTKNITTGEGGMVITKNKDYVNQIKVMALHGISKDAWSRFNDKGYKHYDVKYAGYKYNMIDLLASLGIHQLKNIDKRWLKRKKIWQRYNEAFQSLPFQTPIEDNDKIKHSYHLYTIFLDLKKINISRDQFIAEMHNQNIGVGVHYIALHLQPYYKNKYGYKIGDFINAEKISKSTVSLPLSSKLTQSEQNHIIGSVRMILDKHSK